jgi:hypothetical protein
MLYALCILVGYVACIYSWDWVKLKVSGVETQVRALEDKIKALKASL